MSEPCGICRRIERFTPDDPHVIAELDTGYAVLGDNQIYPGYTLFVAKRCVAELHLLPPDERTRFLHEMAQVAEAVFRAFAPRKLNYELLGNSEAHLHWHLFPRYADDPNPLWPVWNNEAFMQAPRQTPVDPERLRDLREHARTALADVRKQS
jgi:diadenosine tetraphosphate (Ap4A) HIT family hydrolase